jgi:hypothetical protein
MGRRYSTRRGRSPANAACLVEYGGLQMPRRGGRQEGAEDEDQGAAYRTKT